MRTRENKCFCERDQDSNTIEFKENFDRSLRFELESHVKKRVRVRNSDDVGEDKDVDEEIERRLSALGYRE